MKGEQLVMGFTRHKKAVFFVVVVIVLIGVSIQGFSQRDVYLKNGALHEQTWRYNSSVTKIEEEYLVSTFDKITRTSTIETFSIREEKVVRTVIENGITGEITVLGENGELLHEGNVTDFEQKLISSRK